MKTLFKFKSVRMKIVMGFVAVVIITSAVSTFNYFSMKKANEGTEQIVDEEMMVLVAYERMASSMSARIASVRGYLMTGDKTFVEAFDEYTEIGISSEKTIREFEDTEELNLLIDATVNWRQFISENVFDVYDNGKEEEALRNLSSQDGVSTELRNGYEELAKRNELAIDKFAQNMINENQSSQSISLLLSNMITVFAIIIAIITARTISKPVNLVANRMNLIASGQLANEPLVTTSSDEIGQLVVASNELNSKMHAIMSKINDVASTVASHSEELTQSSNEVRGGSEQVSMTMEELARGSETQASSASDLASIMDAFASEVQEANDNGDRIGNYSQEVLLLTYEGQQLMASSTAQMTKIDQIVRETVQKVEGLDAQSQEISVLVSVINTIAEQTNLLALNAAIEAARAGENGRGFSVVADEVRKLAEQVSHSVKDISGIVTRIQNETTNVTSSLRIGYQEVEEGTVQIKTTGETFGKISLSVNNMVDSIQTVSSNLSEIATNSNKISNSIDEIASVSEESAAGIEQTSASIQETTSSMEEVASSSIQLSQLAEELNELVHQFKL